VKMSSCPSFLSYRLSDYLCKASLRQCARSYGAQGFSWPFYPIIASSFFILAITSGIAFLPDASFFNLAAASARE
jgi:hypothetical protein